MLNNDKFRLRFLWAYDFNLAPHEPWTYKPEYANLYSNVSAPRNNGQWDVHRKDAHWVVRNAPSPMSNVSVNWADNAFRSRWRALKSVDDLVENIYNTLVANKLLDKGYNLTLISIYSFLL